MAESDDPTMDAISRYWDALVQREEPLEEGLDPTLAESIAWTISRDDAPAPDARFVRQLEDHLMPLSQTTTAILPATKPGLWTTWNGHAPAPRLAPRDRNGLAPAHLATVALVVLTLVASLIVFSPGRPPRVDHPPVLLPAVAGTPATPTEDELTVEMLLSTTFPADSIPGEDEPALAIWHATIAAGSEVAVPASLVACCPGPKIEQVLSGEVTIRVEGPLRVIRAGGDGTPGPAEAVAQGTEVVLRPGDTAITDFAAAITYTNRGAVPVRLVAGGLFAASPPDPPLGYTVDAFDNLALSSALPPGPLAARLLRATLLPQGTFPAAPPGGVQVVTTGSGAGTMGGYSDGSAINLGRDPVEVYALTLAPAGLVEEVASPIPPAPPGQPAAGPGGADYRFNEVMATDHGGGGQEATGYWLFEPAESDTEALPVIVFLHAQGEGQSPRMYQAWIEHLVRRGAIVIYPSQISMAGRTDPDEALSNVREAIRTALNELRDGEHAQPNVDQVAVVGHGPGAALAADYAATAQTVGLPAPGAVLLGFPGGSAQENLRDIPADTRIVVMAGSGALLDEDAARRLWTGLSALPDEHRAYVRLVSDEHGLPPLEVWHYTPMASESGGPAVVDALDWYGTWKVLDGLLGCAFADQRCEYALGQMPELRFMGTWSDGVPVAAAQVMDDPGTPAPS
jgi:acetyl esterase/lipase